MEPWVNTDKSGLSSVGAALTARVLGHLLWGCAAPTGLKNVYQCLTQGLSPGLCRGIALTGLVSVSASLKLEWGRGEYCVDTALLCNGLVFGLGVEGAEECRRHDTPAKPRVE